MTDSPVFTLAGREINFDFSKITRLEYRRLFDASQPKEEGDETVTRITGLTGEELDAMPQWDWVRLIREISIRANRPDPI